MTVQKAPMCMNCAHLDLRDRVRNSCDAYPDGIPAKILDRTVDHSKPYKGDNGILYAPVELSLEEQLAELEKK